MNTKGIGLGLVISEQIIKAFGGKISLKSIPAPEANHGSVFTFDF
jgi:signal transduction histidine kinase